MRDTNLVNALREHAEWARANEWETPITLGDDLVEAADRIANQSTHIAALQQEIEKLRAQLRHLEKLAEADKDGRLVVLPCQSGEHVFALLDNQTHVWECEVKHAVLDGWRKVFAIRPLGHSKDSYYAPFGAFGQTVFLTREEAEKALEAMKDE